MPKLSPNSNKKISRKNASKSIKKIGKDVTGSTKDFQTEISDSFQFPDYHIKYLSDSADLSILDNSGLSRSSTSDKSTACYFKEFGDFWPYLGMMKISELVKNRRFCFMLNNPQYLRKENRIYLENLERRYQIASQKCQVIELSKPAEVKEVQKEKQIQSDEEFQRAEETINRDFPCYYQYLKSYYNKKKLSSLGNKDNKEFKEVILHCSEQSKDYLIGMEHLFRLFSSTFL